MDLEVLEVMAQYGAIGIIGAIFVISLKKMMAQMMDMNTKIFQYFMDSNAKANESMQNSMLTIIQTIQKNTDTILNSKHEMLDSHTELLKEIKRVQIERAILDEALHEDDVLRKRIHELLKYEDASNDDDLK